MLFFIVLLPLIFLIKTSGETLPQNFPVLNNIKTSSNNYNESEKRENKSKLPNFVIIIVDDLGIGDVGIFGNHTMKTPNIDRIANDGAKLSHNLAADSLCSPSRAALLTGRYPIKSGMATEDDNFPVIIFAAAEGGLPQSEMTIAKFAKTHNYSTGYIGKWHQGMSCYTANDLCHHPNKHGFDYFFGSILTNLSDFGDDGASNLEGFKMFLMKLTKNTALVLFITSLLLKRILKLKVSTIFFFNSFWIVVLGYFWMTVLYAKIFDGIFMRNGEIVEQPIHFENMTKRLVSEGIEFLVNRSIDKDPFVLFMSWLQVHTVLHTSKEFKGVSVHGPYGDNVEEMDNATGQIINELDRLNLLDNTLVYFTSDNGADPLLRDISGKIVEGGYNGIFRGSKGQSAMEGGIRVPGTMMWKNVIKPGTIINTPTSLMDVFPTIASAIIFSKNSSKDTKLASKDLKFENINVLIDDLKLDGIDLQLVLKNESNNKREFLLHYCSREIHSVTYIPISKKFEDIFKIYYAIPQWLENTQRCSSHICQCSKAKKLSSPIIFNISKDPKEEYPLINEEGSIYMEILKKVDEHLKKHNEELEDLKPSQMSMWRMLPRPWLQPCCNFPTCNCIDNKTHKFNY